MNRLLRALAAALTLALCAVPCRAQDDQWSADRSVACPQAVPGCRILQMVMMGSFDAADPEDTVLQRVLACAYPRLAEVTEQDLTHFAGEFGEDTEAVRLRWYDAMARCLRAEIEYGGLPGAGPDAARRVLMLFLSPEGEPDAAAQMAQIRGELTDDALGRIAGAVNAPEDFVRYVIEDYAP